MERAATVELLDFFSMEKDNNANVRSDSNNYDSRLRPSIERRRSFNGIQSVISKINPQLLKSVIASGGATTAAHVPSSSVPCTPHVDREEHPPLPLYVPVHRPSIGGGESDGETAPLTIFYNGTVMVFDVPPHKAEGILKLAVSGSGSVLINKPEIPTVVLPGDHRELLESLTGDLPMTRMISLQRFLEKRKERQWADNPDCTKGRSPMENTRPTFQLYSAFSNEALNDEAIYLVTKGTPEVTFDHVTRPTAYG